MEIYRIFSDNNLDYTVAYKLLIQIFLASVIMISFFASMIILFSSLFKNRYLPAIIISLLLIIFTIINSNYDTFRNIYNPFYLLNFKNILNGFINIEKELQVTEIHYIKAYGFYPYFIYLALDMFLLSISIYILNRENLYLKSRNNSNKIKSIFNFEYFKIVKDRSFLVIFTGIISIFLILFINIYIKNIKTESILFSKYNTSLMNYYISSNLMPIENELTNHIINRERLIEINGEENYKNEINKLREELKEEQKKIEKYRIEKEYYKNKDGKNFYQLRVNQINDLLEKSRIVSTVNLKNFLFTSSSHKETLALYKYMSENNIEPKVLAWPVFASDYEEKTTMNEIDGFDNVFDHSASYIFRKLLKTYPVDLLILFMISFMVLGGYTYDKENGNQIDLINTQPVGKEKIYILKLLSAFIVAVLVLSAIVLFISFLGMITKGIGDLNYPIIYYDELLNPKSIQMGISKYFSLIPVWIYNLRVYVMLILQLLFIISIGNLISMFTKNKFNVFFGSLSIIIIGIFASMKLPDNIRLYLPFNYMNARYIANGAVKIKENIADANFVLIIWVLLISAIFINILGMILSKRVKQ